MRQRLSRAAPLHQKQAPRRVRHVTSATPQHSLHPNAVTTAQPGSCKRIGVAEAPHRAVHLSQVTGSDQRPEML